MCRGDEIQPRAIYISPKGTENLRPFGALHRTKNRCRTTMQIECRFGHLQPMTPNPPLYIYSSLPAHAAWRKRNCCQTKFSRHIYTVRIDKRKKEGSIGRCLDILSLVQSRRGCSALSMRKFTWTFRSSPRCMCRNPRCCTCEKNKSQRDLFICTHTWQGILRLRHAKNRYKKAPGSGEVHACPVAIESVFCTCGVPGSKERVNFNPYPRKHGTKRYGQHRKKTCFVGSLRDTRKGCFGLLAWPPALRPLNISRHSLPTRERPQQQHVKKAALF